MIGNSTHRSNVRAEAALSPRPGVATALSVSVNGAPSRKSARANTRATTGFEKALAWRTLMALHARVADAVERQLECAGAVPLSSYEVLSRLSRVPGAPMRLQDLGDALLLSRSGVTRLVDRLETAGLIQRCTCPTDHRGKFAVLTSAGSAALDEARPLISGAIAQHFSRYINRNDAIVLRSTMLKVLEAGNPGRMRARRRLRRHPQPQRELRHGHDGRNRRAAAHARR